VAGRKVVRSNLKVQVRKLSLEWNHNVSIVWDSNSAQGGYGSWDGIGTQESENSEHGKTSIVQFSGKTTLLGLLRHVLGEAEWIVKVKYEVNIVTEEGEGWELSRLTSAHVMRNFSSASTFIPKLESGDDGEDLPLRAYWNGIPLSLRTEVSTWVGSSGKTLCPWEYNVTLNDVSYEGKHGNTSVLDLGLTKESNGGFISLSPEILIGEGKRIVESYNRVGILGNALKVSPGGGKSSLGRGGGGRGECRGTSDEGGDKSELHVEIWKNDELVGELVS